MNDYARYIEKQRKRLLRYLDPTIPLVRHKLHPLDFVSDVMDEWFVRRSVQPLPAITSAERAFWFTLYQLEQTEELRMMNGGDPMLQYMETILEKMRPVLAAKQDIPPGFWATRPDGEDLRVTDLEQGLFNDLEHMPLLPSGWTKIH